MDAGWYTDIAQHGYHYLGSHVQSSVAFYPGYPLLMRLLGGPFGNVVLAGVLITLVSGAAATWLLFRWTRMFEAERVARWTVAAMLLFPFSYYLTWAVYGDALFLALAIGAFLCLERDHPGWAAVLGALATATRPVGLALSAGLVVRAWERRRQGESVQRWWLVAASALGWLVFTVFQWVRFGTPLASEHSEAAPGWGHSLTWRTVLKRQALRAFTHPTFDVAHTRPLWSAAATLGALLLVPAVRRRYGNGYGLYVVLALVGPLVVSPDFTGMPRYVLAAFPCFAAAGGILAEHRRAGYVFLAGGAGGLAVLTSMFARGFYLS